MEGKKFNSKLINVYYAEHTHNLKLSAEISVETRPDREVYLRGTYFLPFARSQKVWLKERRQFFNKKKAYDIDESYIQVTQNGMPFEERLYDEPTLSFTLGILFK